MMSLSKIQRYVSPIQSKLQSIASQNYSDASNFIHHFRKDTSLSESIIQKRNWKNVEKNWITFRNNSSEKLLQSFKLIPIPRVGNGTDYASILLGKSQRMDIPVSLKDSKNNEAESDNHENHEKSETKQRSSKDEPCKKCQQIRNSVKSFLQTTFYSTESDSQKSHKNNQIRMHVKTINPDKSVHITITPTHGTNATHNSNQANVIKHHTAGIDSFPASAINHTKKIGSKISKLFTDSVSTRAQCSFCDPASREPSVRGPPLISPVCRSKGSNENKTEASSNQQETEIHLAPRGEVHKPLPDRKDKAARIDRPRSVRSRKSAWKENLTETSLRETVKKHQNRQKSR